MLRTEKSDDTKPRRFRSETTHHSNRRHDMKEKTTYALRCMLAVTKHDPFFFLIWGISLAILIRLAAV